MNNGRTLNVLRNIGVSIVSQCLTLILSFISRTAFIKLLGAEYLGINGLFSNILTMLSFAELGIGNAIIFSMYKPLAEKDEIKIKALMKLYKKAYRVIAIIIAICGIIIIPFLDVMIKEAPSIKEDIVIIYLLFLVNTIVSYFYVYKKSIIIADQKNYIVVINQQIFYFIQTIAQIVFLLITKDYIKYLIIQIICTFAGNYFVSKKADTIYPYLRDRDIKPLDKLEIKEIYINVKALFLYKFGSVILNGTDNIIIAALIGVTEIGISSNYILIISAVTTIVSQVLNAFTASIGNLNVLETNEKKYEVFNQLFYISTCIYSFCGVGLMLFINPLIKLWLGEGYLLSDLATFALVLHFYVNGVQFASYTYRTTMGLFVKSKYTPIYAAMINILLSIVLSYPFGLAGVYFATSIARLLTTTWVDPVMIYKSSFNKHPILYFIKYSIYAMVTIMIYFISKNSLQYIETRSWVQLMLNIILYIFIWVLIMGGLFYKTKESKSLRIVMNKLMKQIVSRLSLIR